MATKNKKSKDARSNADKTVAEILSSFNDGLGVNSKDKSKNKKSKDKIIKYVQEPTEYVQDSLALSGLEVYKTKELAEVTEDSKDKSKDKKDNSKEDSDKNSNNTSNNSKQKNDDGYTLLNGEIIGISFYNELVNNSFEYDYEDIDNNGSLTLVKVDDSKFYKGKKVCLKKAWQTPKKNLVWDDLKSCLMGFITDQTYTEDGVDIKLSGMSKLLEKEELFSFNDTKISEVLKEMIESAGLKANIDVTGLKDEKISYTNISKSGSGTLGGQGKNIDELVSGWVGSETDELAKAKLVHNGLKSYGIRYAYYLNSKYHTPDNCLKHAQSPGLNCGDTSILTVSCMKSAGLNAYTVLRCDSAHFFTVIEIGGTKYYSDLTAARGALSSRAWNDTWEHNKCGRKYNLK